ncbi:MAG TPA: hypothetical protein VF852_04690 [Pseudolabrys sp.]
MAAADMAAAADMVAAAAAFMRVVAAAFMQVVLVGAPASEAEAVASERELLVAAFPVARR